MFYFHLTHTYITHQTLDRWDALLILLRQSMGPHHRARTLDGYLLRNHFLTNDQFFNQVMSGIF